MWQQVKTRTGGGKISIYQIKSQPTLSSALQPSSKLFIPRNLSNILKVVEKVQYHLRVCPSRPPSRTSIKKFHQKNLKTQPETPFSPPHPRRGRKKVYLSTRISGRHLHIFVSCYPRQPSFDNSAAFVDYLRRTLPLFALLFEPTSHQSSAFEL